MRNVTGNKRRDARRRGFTLLEVLVASTIMAIAVGTIFAALSTSLNVASRVTQRDQAALQAGRILEDLLANTTLPRGQELQGHLNTAQYGMEADWRAQVTPIEVTPSGWGVDRITLEMAWRSGGLVTGRPASIQLNGYRTTRIAGGGAKP